MLAAIDVTAARESADAMVEWRYFDLEAQIYGGLLSPMNGQIKVPEGPGLGVDPDPNVLRDYLRDEKGSQEDTAA